MALGAEERLVTEESLVVAVDVGGSNSRTVVVLPDGTCLGIGLGSGANPVSLGTEAAATIIADGVINTVESIGRTGAQIACLLVAAAGGSHKPELPSVIRERLLSAGIDSEVQMVADGLAAFHSHSHLDSGYILVGGTGGVSQRVRNGVAERVGDGLGWLLGDSGGGYWLGSHVVRAVLADLDGRGESTALTPLLLEACGYDPTDLSHDGRGRPGVMRRIELRIYDEPPTRLARFAPLALAAGDDPVAQALLDRAAGELAATIKAVLAPDLPGPIVVAGGLLTGTPVLRQKISDALAAEGLPSELHPVHDGLVGAAVMALRSMGVGVDEEVFANLAHTVALQRVA